MDPLHFLLEKYRQLTPRNHEVKKLIQNFIWEHLGTKIEISDIKIQRETVHITTSPVVKSEITILKQQLLSELKAQLGLRAPKDIR